MNTEYIKLENAKNKIREITDFVPKVALVLGSGLGGFAKNVEIVSAVSYSDIPGFPVSTVQGHSGRFIFGYIGNVPVAVMQGRVHYYEGYEMNEVVMPIRLLKLLGAETLILTNAAGGINESYSAGDFMLLKGHISSFVPSVLRGKNIDELGTRFPDMSAVYDAELRDKAKAVAEKLGIKLNEGVYLQTQGPNFETPEEIKMFAILGADAVGMSTACEAIAARHMGMRICAISCISNMAAGISPVPLTHEEVQETADRVAVDFERLVKALVEVIG